MTTREMIYIIRYRARQLQQERDSYSDDMSSDWFETNRALDELTNLANDLEQMDKDSIPF